MLKVFLPLVLLILVPVETFASAAPDHVACEIEGIILDKKTSTHIDRFMGGEQKRKTYDVSVKISSSKVSQEAMMGECPSIDAESTFSFQTPLDRFKFKKGQCIRATSKFSGSTTFNATWIYDIQKLPVEKCAQ